MYDIVFSSKRAEKEFSKMDNNCKNDVKKAFEILKANPRSSKLHFDHLKKDKNIKRAKNKRIRIIYKINEDEQTLIVGKIFMKRDSSYRGEATQSPKAWF